MIAILGPAGSGKSSQGKTLARLYGFRWLSVGEVIRNTKQFQEITQKGELVDDRVVIELMNKEIAKAEADGADVILDGYPRDLIQAEWIAANDLVKQITGIIVLKVSREELWRRIEIRGRSDDLREVVERRFAIFEENVEQILRVLTTAGVRVAYINGEGTEAEVTQRLVMTLASWGKLDLTRLTNPQGDSFEEKSYGE